MSVLSMVKERAVPSAWSIGQLASATGEEIKTLRYWTNAGLLRHTRLENGHRVYPPQVADDVRFLRAAQQAGFSLNAIERVLRWPTDDQAVAEQVGAIRGHIAHLQAMEQLLLARIKQSSSTGRGTNKN